MCCSSKTMNIFLNFFIVLFSTSSAVQLGRIQNATFLFDSPVSILNWTNRSCSQCLCQFVTNPTLFSAVSCQITNENCQILFRNSTAQIQRRETSLIYMFNTNWARLNSLPICNPMCLNGGVCIANNTCQCFNDLWTGSLCQTPKQVMWKFDENFLDSYSYFNGIPINSPTFRSPGIDGSGTCLYLNSVAQQSVTISSPPFLDMSWTSFTISVWINANSFNNGSDYVNCDNSIFAQHDQDAAYRSLHFVLRRGRPHFGVFSSDTTSLTTLRLNHWFHLAFVYNNVTRQQLIYINGLLHVSGSFRSPYQGTSGNVTIGTGSIALPNNFWDGCLDQLTFHSYAKSTNEILRDATLTIFYAFENNLLDQGPLTNHGNGSNVLFTSPGRNSSAAANFNVTSSFIKSKFLIPISSSNQSFSLALWINPRLTTRGTLVQFSNERTDIIWTIPMLGFTSDGYVIAQLCSTTQTTVTIGPQINTNVWTHLTVTYSGNSLGLWINGITFTSVGSSFDYYSSFSSPFIATIGSSTTTNQTCASTLINMGQYIGLIDQFQIYSRVLSSSEILALTNT